MNEITQLITTLGFPIVTCIFLGWYVKIQTDNYRSDVSQLQTEHKEEIMKVTEAINNNTLALTKLVDKLDKEVEQNAPV
jgi:hypothetical protein